jgi:putative peptide zinc metalloprotease protein
MAARPGLHGLLVRAATAAGVAVSIQDQTVRLHPLTLVDDGDDVLVGHPEQGTYVAVPKVAGLIVRRLLAGATLKQVTADAAAFAGEPVDVEDFVDTLRELGFVAGDDDGQPALPLTPTAPVQQRRWNGGPPARLVRPLFSRFAWTCYALAAVWSVASFLIWPRLLPHPGRVFFASDDGVSILALFGAVYLLVAIHELWHWLAARALGIKSRFGIDRRLFFLVIETDLSQLWSVPRRSRYGPQLAGLAIDMLILGLLQVVAVTASPPRIISALAYVVVANSLWQCMIFLRTDLYGVFVTATGCRDLWRVKSLLLRRAFGRLSQAQAGELAAAGSRDLAVGSWFRWLFVGGCCLAVGYFGYFFVPVLWHVTAWSATGLRLGPGQVGFWWRGFVGVLTFLPIIGVVAVAARAAVLARGGRSRPDAG